MSRHRTTGGVTRWTYVIFGLIAIVVVLLIVYPSGSKKSSTVKSSPQSSLTMSGTPVLPRTSAPPLTSLPATSSEVTPSSPSASFSITPPFVMCAAGTPPNYICYKVQPGDYLIKITQEFANAGLETVYQWNSTAIGQNPNLIHPGLILVVKVIQ